jgi:hypothetical protein
MKNQIQHFILERIKELHIKILQSNDLPEIGNYLQEILDKVIPVLPTTNIKSNSGVREITRSSIIDIMKSDIRSILDGTYRRAEIAKYKASLDIAWLKKLFTDTSAA